MYVKSRIEGQIKWFQVLLLFHTIISQQENMGSESQLATLDVSVQRYLKNKVNFYPVSAADKNEKKLGHCEATLYVLWNVAQKMTLLGNMIFKHSISINLQ